MRRCECEGDTHAITDIIIREKSLESNCRRERDDDYDRYAYNDGDDYKTTMATSFVSLYM